MPFDATGFEEDLPPQRGFAGPAMLGLIFLPLPTIAMCWAAWGVLRAATGAVGWTCFVLALAYMALAITAAVMIWSRD